jgi:hypothetical protein
MASNRPPQHPPWRASSAGGGRHHRLRSRPRGWSSPAGSPDLAAAAREAVVGFLHDSSMDSPAGEAAPPPGAMTTPKTGATAVAETLATDDAGAGPRAATRVRIPASLTPGATGADADLVAVRAAASGVATLERIEAAAAKVEADIRAALLAQAELQAGAGAAAEAAVRAAEKSWIAAHTAEAAEGRARVILGVMSRYLAVTIALVVVTIIFLAITATVAH